MANDISSDSLCRACIAPHFGEKVDLFSVPEVSRIYAWLSTSRVDKNDPLPKQICAPCYHQLEAINRFRTMCTESYNTLSSQFSKYTVSGREIRYEITFPNNDTTNAVSSQRTLHTEQDLKKKNYTVQSDQSNLNDDISCERVGNVESSECCELVELDDSSDSENSDEVMMIEMQPDIEYFNGSTLSESRRRSDESHLTIDSDTENYAEYLLPDNEQTNYDLDNEVEQQLSSTRSGTYKCNRCPRKFSVKERYIGHMRQHQGLKPFECNQCHKIYSRLERLRNHIQNDHSGRSVRYCCPIADCFKKYKNRETLKRHFVLHESGALNESEKHISGKTNTSESSNTNDSKKLKLDDEIQLPKICGECQSRYDFSTMFKNQKFHYKSGNECKCLICGMGM